MPLATITDWVYGPMGTGFLLLRIPANRDVFYDGGPMHDLTGNDNRIKDKRKRENEYETDMLTTVSLLMLDL